MPRVARLPPEPGRTALPLEVEAKLDARSERVLRAIAERSQIGSYRLLPQGTVSLHSTYFDTRALTLARNGVALRVRGDGERWEATAKWSGQSDGVLHTRPELTVALSAPPAQSFTLPAGEIHERLRAFVAGRPLRPLVQTDITRQRFLIVPASSVRAARPLAELALDTVTLRPPKRTRVVAGRYCEVEIERLSGSPAEVLALAATLQREFRLTPSRLSKFARGLAAVHGQQIASLLQEEGLNRSAIEELPRAIVARHLRRLREHDPGARRGEDPEAVHDMRVAVRRLRTALRVFPDALPRTRRDRLRRELRWLGQQLGGVRDLDVQLERLAAERNAVRGGGIDGFAAHLRAERKRQRVVLLASLDSPRYFRLHISLEGFAHPLPSLTPGAARRGIPSSEATSHQASVATNIAPTRLEAAHNLERLLRRTFARLRRAAAEAKRDPSEVHLHAARIRAKRLRYTLEFADPIAGKPGRRLVKQVTAIQDLLGTHHDAVVAAGLLRDFLARRRRQRRTQAGLQELLHLQERTTASTRHAFERLWRDFARKKAKRDIRAVAKQLRRAGETTAVAKPEPTARRSEKGTVVTPVPAESPK